MKCCTRSKGVLHHDVKVLDEIESLKSLSILKLLCNCTKWIPKNSAEKKKVKRHCGEKIWVKKKWRTAKMVKIYG